MPIEDVDISVAVVDENITVTIDCEGETTVLEVTEVQESVTITVSNGADGASAYAVAVAAGFVGTEAQWLASLDGADGASAYDVAVAAGFVGTEAEWLASLDGADGASAYDVAVAAGFVGTEAQWLASLDGSDGASAYDVAVAAGFVGTEAQWLTSLDGADGASAYDVAVAAGFVGTEAQWLASLDGADGASAYDVAVAAGFVGTEAEWLASLEGADGPDESAVSAIAAGSTLGLQQELLANAGQVGLNILAVGLTNTGKVQGVSLGAGNVVTVYAAGDFPAGIVLYREFLAFGEPICFTGLSNGAIITSTQGFYGASENILSAVHVASMPLLSLGLSFTDSFMFSFRNSDRTPQEHAFLFIVNGAIKSTVEVTYGSGASIADQPPQTIDPFQFTTVYLDGNSEYRIQSTNPIMVCTACGFNNSDYESASTPQGAGPRDARLVLPVSNDIITHPRSGNLSALFDGTVVDWWDVAGDEGNLNDGSGISPGSPVDIDSAIPTGTANNQTDYRPEGFTRFRAVGLISAYSGADGSGGDASPACPVSAMSQIVAQPFYIDDSGNGDNTSITISSPYVGTAKVYEWNDTTGVLDLAYTVPLNRQGVTVATADDQNHPTAGQISNEPDAGVVTLVGALAAGVVVADVPVMVISQSNTTDTATITLRSQNGTTTAPIDNQDDETLMFGITPKSIAAEIREDANGILRLRTIDAAGTETWEIV